MSDELRALVAQGLSDPAIAARLNVTARTILRRRHALGIGTQWQPPLPPHGTVTRYGKPHKCRCRACTKANTEAQRDYRATMQGVTVPTAHATQRPWTPQEDAQLMDSTLSTAALARALGRSWDATRKRRERLRAT